MKILAGGALLALACSGAQALTLVSSNFDSGTEGWTAINGARSPGATFVASGGDAGGYITAQDSSLRRIWLWKAPAAYLGDQSAAFGGSLSYSMRVSTLAGDTERIPDVKLLGAGLSLVADAGQRPGLDWTRFSIALTPGAWRLDGLDGALASADQLKSVLGSLDALRIRGEYSLLARDSGSLDSVALVGIVPEPASWALWLFGLAAVGTLARRR